MTAYRQIALDCAAALQPAPLPLKILRAQVPRAGAIVQRNYYGWFDREARGIYRLTKAGEAALRRWPINPTPEAGRRDVQDSVTPP